MSQYRFSTAERFGVWEAHDGVCFWCGEPLEYRHATIDHVLPESLENDPKKLSAILKLFALAPDFKINDFQNWVPAHQSCNAKKNATVFSPSPVMVASLEYVSRRASKAQSVSEKVAKDRKKGKVSLSEILCVRHNMSPRSMYAKQDEQEESGGAVAAHSQRSD